MTLLSLAGIPLTLGFVAKFYALASGVGADLSLPVAALILGSVIGLFYYLRIIISLLRTPPQAAPAHVNWIGASTVAILLVLLIGLGIYPGPLVSAIRTTVLANTVLASD